MTPSLTPATLAGGTSIDDVLLAADALVRALTLGSDVALCASLAETLRDDLAALAGGAAPFAQRYPAAARWSATVLKRPGRRAPLDVAAAHELAAVQCLERGDEDAAAREIDAARALAMRGAA